jgi:hypothetical protein
MDDQQLQNQVIGRAEDPISRNGIGPVQTNGCTLSAYATLKRLPESFLRELGLTECFRSAAPAVCMPYLTGSGEKHALRFRTALEKSEKRDNRFSWEKGSKPILYGLWRLRQDESVVIVEGESDCHTLWYHGINAVGLPGAGQWSESRDAVHLSDFGSIYVVIEPDQGGATMVRWVAESGLKERVRFVSASPFKDPSGMHVADPQRFQERWKEAISNALPWSKYGKELALQLHLALVP